MISNNQIKLIRQLEQKKHRQRLGLFVAEGPKVVGDLLRAGYSPHAVYAVEGWQPPVEVPFQTVTPDELRRISFLQHPQQVLALFPLPACPPQTAAERPTTLPEGLCLALDGVQDPGNLGTIIRLADWFGISTVYCSPDTADAWNPKVVQATMGSIAHVRIVYTPLVPLLQQTQLPIYGTLLDGDDIYRQSLSAEGIIVMGNEGNGISPAVRQLVNHRLLIPSFSQGPAAESLNVAIATAIVCSEFRRPH
jgi:TrmH family RNA methyltransferase